MTILHQCRLHLLQLGTQPCFDRLTAKQEALAIPRFSTDVGEPQKVEGLRFAQAPLLPIDLGVTPKFNQPGLFRMQAKTESLQAFPKVRQKTPCVPHVLESHHESSSPGELHPQALTETDMRLSPHPALMVQSPVVSPSHDELLAMKQLLLRSNGQDHPHHLFVQRDRAALTQV